MVSLLYCDMKGGAGTDVAIGVAKHDGMGTVDTSVENRAVPTETASEAGKSTEAHFPTDDDGKQGKEEVQV